MIVAAVVSILVVIVLTVVIIKARKARRLAYIRQYRFHPSLKERVRKSYPELSEKQLEMVFKALRDYFHFCLLARKQMVAMPSQVVDVAWHEFILFTHHYQEFSNRAIGRFLHHTPTEAMKTPTLAHEGLKRVWRMACAHEGINPAEPKKLPLLFAIDGLLDIKDGFRYSLDCQNKKNNPLHDSYCAAHIGCSSGCVGDSGSSSDSVSFFADSDGGSSCGGD